MAKKYRKIAQFKTVDLFAQQLDQLKLSIPVDEQILTARQNSPMAEPVVIGDFSVGNRWCIHPMEGWDAHPDGSPTELTIRRWKRFGESGAKLIWGGEAAAVRADGRANPNQTMAIDSNRDGLALLQQTCRNAHKQKFGSDDDFLLGLQLTHSGRFCRPNSKTLEPRIAYHHPILDNKFGIDPNNDDVVWTPDQLEELMECYVSAAKLAAETGFQFVDVKACHGYLLHEFLSARSRTDQYGGSFENRSRLLIETIERIQNEVPNIGIVVRLSIFDAIPFRKGDEAGEPEDFEGPYLSGFGVDTDNPTQQDLTEPIELLKILDSKGVWAVNLSAGSPYYNPHFQRPAIFPPSDGYLAPEDPLVGVFRQIDVARQCKQAVPDLPIVGSAYSYLQDYLPHVAQAVIRKKWVDMVGLGRMFLSYPNLPAETLDSGSMQRKLICRTFSDCTTAPRIGLVSGCYPLDDLYKKSDAFLDLAKFKKQSKS